MSILANDGLEQGVSANTVQKSIELPVVFVTAMSDVI